MTQEDKQLLIKDLCARLPYKVMIQSVGENKCLGLMDLADIDLLPKPYLRPMSSMTEEERIELDSIPFSRLYKIVEDDLPWSIANYRQLDWLNVNHFDYRGLIQKGLALEASEEMYNLKEK